MSKKKGRKYTIDMNRFNRRMAYHPVQFKTGGHMTEKDRPRKKDWIKEAGSAREE